MQKFFRRIDVNDFDAEIVGESFHHLFSFIQTQQAVIDKHASELFADGFVD